MSTFQAEAASVHKPVERCSICYEDFPHICYLLWKKVLENFRKERQKITSLDKLQVFSSIMFICLTVHIN